MAKQQTPAGLIVGKSMQMNISQPQQKWLNVAVYAAAVLLLLAVAFTLTQWFLTGDFQAQNALLVTVLSALTLVFYWLKKQSEVEQPVPAESAPVSERLNLTPLRQQINHAFNLEELHTLSFDLGIDFDDLAGQTKSAKVVSLLEYAQRHQLLPALLQALTDARPNVGWYEPAVFTAQDLRLRDKVLRNVQAAWIDGFLNKSLQHEVVLELGLVEKPKDVTRSSGIVLRRSGQDDRALPDEASLREIFEAYGPQPAYLRRSRQWEDDQHAATGRSADPGGARAAAPPYSSCAQSFFLG